MSYSLIGTFKDDKDSILYVANLDMLKNINERRYDVSLMNVSETEHHTFNIKSFEEGYRWYFDKYMETKPKLEELTKIRYSPKFYTDKKEENEKLIDDINYTTDILQEYKNGFETCLCVIGMFEMLSNFVIEDDIIERKVKLEIKAE